MEMACERTASSSRTWTFPPGFDLGIYSDHEGHPHTTKASPRPTECGHGQVGEERATFGVISDTHDTIKITEVCDRLKAAQKLYFFSSVVSGMAPLYNEVINLNTSKSFAIRLPHVTYTHS